MRALVLLIAVSFTARAEDPAVAVAKRHFRQGASYFKQGKYDQAITEYQEAQKHLLLPDFDFNLGQAYRLKGEPRSALESYKRYLLAVPDGEIADQARGYVVQLSVEVDDLDRREKLRAQPLRVEPPPVVVQPSPTPAPELAFPIVERPPQETPVWKRWWLWTAVGVAAAGLAVGLGVGLTANSSSPPSTSFGTVRPFP